MRQKSNIELKHEEMSVEKGYRDTCKFSFHYYPNYMQFSKYLWFEYFFWMQSVATFSTDHIFYFITKHTDHFSLFVQFIQYFYIKLDFCRLELYIYASFRDCKAALAQLHHIGYLEDMNNLTSLLHGHNIHESGMAWFNLQRVERIGSTIFNYSFIKCSIELIRFPFQTHSPRVCSNFTLLIIKYFVTAL